MPPKPKPKKVITSKIIKPNVTTKTPSYSYEEVRKMQDPGRYVDPKTKKSSRFSKQYKA